MTEIQDRALGTAWAPDQGAAPIQPGEGTRLNHVEFLHRPGESSLVIELFESLNCQCEQTESPQFGKYIVVHMGSKSGDNDFFASEAEEEQLALEDALKRHFDLNDSDLTAGYTQYRRMLERRPYRAAHIGVRLPSVAVYDTVIQRLESLSVGKFSGRLTLGHSIPRTAEEAQDGRPLKQLWVWTDLISTGLLATGQQIEIQTYAP